MDQSNIAEVRVYRRRWLILAIFCCLSLSNEVQWIEYSVITDTVKKYYDVSYVAVDWLSIIYEVVYIPLVFPATWLLDRFGLRMIVGLGAFGNCLGAWIKCASVAGDRFYVTFIGQTIAGCSQVFILGIPPRLAAVWFGAEQVSSACAIGVFGNQLGIAIGFLISPMIVKEFTSVEQTSKEFQALHYSVAAFTTLILISVYFFFSNSPPLPPSAAQKEEINLMKKHKFSDTLMRLFKNRNYLLLLLSYGINVGAFYALSTLLSQMISGFYQNEDENIGRIGLLMVLAGMLGSIVSGVWLDKTHTFKWTTVVVYGSSFLGMILFTFTLNIGHLWIVFVVAGVLGFFMTGYMALGFELGTELTFPDPEGTVSGLLNATAQVFAITFTLALGEFVDVSQNILYCNLTFCVCMLIGTVLTVLIKSDLRRQRAAAAVDVQNVVRF